ncbi:MAG: M15 family metallopeptidase [Oscillospiraceae bacterium]|nr:M15 family metallopeptidase [Oscillospiraceae bacterium]
MLRRKGLGKMARVMRNAVVITMCALALLLFVGRRRFPKVQSSELARNSGLNGEQAKTKEIDMARDFAPKTKLTARHDGWRLILVNCDHPLADDFLDSVTLKAIHGTALKVDERILDDLEQMLGDAKNDGIDLEVYSAYRSFQRQKVLFEQGVKERVSNGMKRDEAEQETATWIARPGSSEHHTGLAVDIATPSHQGLDESFRGTAAYQWLLKNAPKYGFVERYPQGKVGITHINPEPWHYRYIGRDLAPLLEASGLCYEEYFECYLAPIFESTNLSQEI